MSLTHDVTFLAKNERPDMKNATVFPPSDEAPRAEKRPHSETWHGVTIEDPYHWLKSPTYPDVTQKDILDYLQKENAYFDEFLGAIGDKKQAMFEELKARIPAEDKSVPVKDGAYYYHWAFKDGAQHLQWFRSNTAGHDMVGADLLLDENVRAEGVETYHLHALSVSPAGDALAWAEDNDGSERCKIYVKPLKDGAAHENIDGAQTQSEGRLEVENAYGKVVWQQNHGAEEAQPAFYYVELNKNLQPYRVRRHVVGTAQKNDAVIYENNNTGMFVSVSLSQSRQWIFIRTGDHQSTEIRALQAVGDGSNVTLITPMREGHEYYCDHAGDDFYILTNRHHANFEIARVGIHEASEDHWQTLIAGDDDHYLTGFTCFEGFMAIEERQQGLDQVYIAPYDAINDRVYVPFEEASYCAGLGDNREFHQGTLRISYESMVTPKSVLAFEIRSKSLVTLKQQAIPSGYNPDDYQAERLMVKARDGMMVPLSLVYKKGMVKNGQNPLHLYGYGAYGLGMPPYFSTARLSLLDRGFVYAIAHIRGGDEMGRHWYEDYRGQKRTTTFYDFIDVADHLIKENYTSAGIITTSGGSAGGSLMGFIANERPDLWAGIVAHVPFVDILNTMLDDQLPLTPMEWPEWGNPIKDASSFKNINSYCPYQNVKSQAYPPLLVTAGLNDPRVTYWEPAKWVAKLRTHKSNEAPLFLKTNMASGHQGKSGRFDSLHEVAEEYCFLLEVLGTA